MRTRLELQGPEFSAAELRDRLKPVSDEFDATLSIRAEQDHPRVLVMVSQYDHCLLDLIYRQTTGELAIEIALVVSNHYDLASAAESAGIAFEHVPTGDKEQAEHELRRLLASHEIDFVVLARYMQILSPAICHDFAGRIINIHHSFLPGFKGANPYARAWQRGVKLIGATAHYVTAELDEGPIIAQATEPVSHLDTAQTMMVKGRDIERRVLAAAVRAHSEERIFLVGDPGASRTVVFDD